jgi:hypothetical protein
MSSPRSFPAGSRYPRHGENSSPTTTGVLVRSRLDCGRISTEGRQLRFRLRRLPPPRRRLRPPPNPSKTQSKIIARHSNTHILAYLHASDRQAGEFSKSVQPKGSPVAAGGRATEDPAVLIVGVQQRQTWITGAIVALDWRKASVSTAPVGVLFLFSTKSYGVATWRKSSTPELLFDCFQERYSSLLLFSIF